ncbi:MAG: 7-carboxy-7-deazaguanine synthase QueE [Marinilabilia sp.]
MNNKLVLANEGVFPITRNREGQRLKQMPATGLDLAGTIQGEGKLMGVPSLFVRLAGCNLRCIWQLPDGSFSRCDTPYASFDHPQDHSFLVNEVFDLVRHNTKHLQHLVITGGEPLLQKKALAPLLKQIKEKLDLHITIETNGTIFSEEVAPYIDLFSISPKLSNSEPSEKKLGTYGIKPSGPTTYHGEKRRNMGVLQDYIDFCRANDKDLQLKFVAARPSDPEEIKNDFLDHLKGWEASDIVLMPLGANAEELNTTSGLVLEMAIRNGWRFAPRIHIDVFGPKAGV